MTSRFFILTFIALFVLISAHENDDFKEMEDKETEPEVEMDESENDEASEARMPRLLSRSRYRFGSSRRTSSSISSTRRSTSGSRGFFGRRSSTGGTSGTRSGFFRRSGSSGTRSGFFRRNRSSGSSGTRSGFFRRSSSRTGGSSTRRTSGGGTSLPSLGTVIDLAQLGTDITNTVLNSIANVERKIVVGLGNKGEADWTAGTVFMETGSSLELLPLNVAKDEGVQLAGIKPTGYEREGVAGCLCYEFIAYDDDDEVVKLGKSFCLMFKVPWSGDNYWNVKIYDGLKQAEKATYDDLVNSNPMKAGTPVAEKELMRDDENGLIYYVDNVSMTNAGQATLQVYAGVKKT